MPTSSTPDAAWKRPAGAELPGSASSQMGRLHLAATTVAKKRAEAEPEAAKNRTEGKADRVHEEVCFSMSTDNNRAITEHRRGRKSSCVPEDEVEVRQHEGPRLAAVYEAQDELGPGDTGHGRPLSQAFPGGFLTR